MASDTAGRFIPLESFSGGGIVLGYRCNSRCRHCLYACGPHRRDGGVPPDGDGVAPSAVERLVELLARSPMRKAVFHVGGGEPFLDPDLLCRVLSLSAEAGLRVEYVETNAFWASDEESTSSMLERVSRAGCRSLLVSLSPFHAEFVPWRRPLGAASAASGKLPGGAFLWLSAFVEDLREWPPDEVIDWGRFCASRDSRWKESLLRRYGLVQGGRAGRFAAVEAGVRLSASAAAAASPCRGRLADTTHFHVDTAGYYVPGLCAGLQVPLEETLEAGGIVLDGYPLLEALWRGGAGAALELARGYGFRASDSYSSPCDLCTHIRFHLYAVARGEFPELGPPGFYAARSLAPYSFA